MKGCKHRSCVINGSKALFHKWTEKELLILKLDMNVKPEKLFVIRKNYEETGIVPKMTTIDKIKSTVAIVEFEDGTVKEVEPASIKFLDSFFDMRPSDKEKLTLNYKVVAVDFDGTLCEDKWPGIGAPNWEVIDYLRDEKIHGGAKLILWTCRTDGKLKDAIEWCKEHGLKFDAVNENLPERIKMFGTDPRKIGADEYIDDRACTKFKLPFVFQKKEITELQVLDDMYNPNGGPVSWAARDYYYTNYATSEEQRQMDKEEKFQTIFAFSVMIGIFLLCVVMVISSIF